MILNSLMLFFSENKSQFCFNRIWLCNGMRSFLVAAEIAMKIIYVTHKK